MGFGDESGIGIGIRQTICTLLQTDNHTNTSSTHLTDETT